MWDEITYPFPNFNIELLKFGNGYVISPHTLLDTITCHAGIKGRLQTSQCWL